MFSKAKVKYVQSLGRKKHRQRYDKFVAEGTKIIEEMLLSPNIEIEFLAGSVEWLSKHQKKLGKTPSIEVSQRELEQLSLLKNANDVLVVASQLKPDLDKECIQNDLTIYLDAIQDPGNLGTIIRIADWFGIKYVLLGTGTVDLYNPKVIQASMGAFLRVSCFEMPQEELFDTFPEVRIMGADLQGENVFGLPKQDKKGIVVIGNEGNGISPFMRDKIKNWVSIPSYGGSESLNASVATGIICAALRN